MFRRTCVPTDRVGVRFYRCMRACKGALARESARARAPACVRPSYSRVRVRVRAHASVARTPLWRDCVAALPWLAWLAPSVWTFSCTLSCEKETRKKDLLFSTVASLPPSPLFSPCTFILTNKNDVTVTRGGKRRQAVIKSISTIQCKYFNVSARN